MDNLKITICDLNVAVAEVMGMVFGDCPNVSVRCKDILSEKADAILSPANSFGYMDGGIDLAYRRRFGMDIQHQLQRTIIDNFDGELPIGNAVVCATGDPEIPTMIAAPTMRVPEDVSETLNAYTAFRAALVTVKYLNEEMPLSSTIHTLLTPGFCTATGRMTPRRAAYQMRVAYLAVKSGRKFDPDMDVATIREQHMMMRTL